MHVTLALANRKLADLRKEFDNLIAIEAEVIPALDASPSAVARSAKSILRSSGIEGIYTGIEGVLKEIVTTMDEAIPAAGDSWHARLLAQAALRTDAREAIVSEETYKALDRLRSFRHLERNVYRHALRPEGVDENFDLMRKVFDDVHDDIRTFLEARSDQLDQDVGGSPSGPR